MEDANKVKLAMFKLDINQAQLGRRLGLSQSVISRFASGTRPLDRRTCLAIDGLLARHGIDLSDIPMTIWRARRRD